MLPKTPKSGIWKFVKGSAKTLFVIEAVAFAASYAVYYRMNTNRGGCSIYFLCRYVDDYMNIFRLIHFASSQQIVRPIAEGGGL